MVGWPSRRTIRGKASLCWRCVPMVLLWARYMPANRVPVSDALLLTISVGVSLSDLDAILVICCRIARSIRLRQ